MKRPVQPDQEELDRKEVDSLVEQITFREANQKDPEETAPPGSKIG